MRLVIEREGGFTVVEDADAITEIDVQSYGVKLTLEAGGDKYTKSIPVTDHAEACRVSAAIAARCGTLVEPLAKGPEAVKASEWATGEPPKDGRWYVVRIDDDGPYLAKWHVRGCFEDELGNQYVVSPSAHVASPVPAL